MTNAADTTIPHARATVEQAIEELIGLLDFLDPDPDLEENGDVEPSGDENEPSLGSLDRLPQTRWAEASHYTSHDTDLELDTADDEPSLGWSNSISQAKLSASPGDREWECEDEGAEHDGREGHDRIMGGQGL